MLFVYFTLFQVLGFLGNQICCNIMLPVRQEPTQKVVFLLQRSDRLIRLSRWKRFEFLFSDTTVSNPHLFIQIH